MRKVFLLLVLLVGSITANAESYRIKYNGKGEKVASFVVTLSSDNVIINNDVFSLRRLGTITNSGLTFNSYCYGRNDGMLCVSTSSIAVGDLFRRITGYIIMIDNKAYIADKITKTDK